MLHFLSIPNHCNPRGILMSRIRERLYGELQVFLRHYLDLAHVHYRYRPLRLTTSYPS
jgi:hypothetical protein